MSYRFAPREGLIIVPTRVFGPAGDAIVRLALDTGATRTLINTKVPSTGTLLCHSEEYP